ncbi:hypothetical protein AB0C69_21085, partial [Actinomadura sp. NPDC048032]|uniref:hypothetical protein n=1 Tax=Actinomadura sp. NPDC048032 TaxID=3155747 RepID=UPI0033CDCC82
FTLLGEEGALTGGRRDPLRARLIARGPFALAATGAILLALALALTLTGLRTATLRPEPEPG